MLEPLDPKNPGRLGRLYLLKDASVFADASQAADIAFKYEALFGKIFECWVEKHPDADKAGFVVRVLKNGAPNGYLRVYERDGECGQV